MVHKSDDFAARTKFGLLEFWTLMFIVIVFLSPVLELLGKSSVYFVVLLSLLGYSIYVYLTGKTTHNLPAFAYLYAAFSRELIKHKNTAKEENSRIAYQTLVRLFGDKIATKALAITDFPPLDQLTSLIRRLTINDRRFMMALLCQLYVFKNLQCQYNDEPLKKIASLLGITPDEYYRLKQIYLSKEYSWQTKNERKQQTRQTSGNEYYKILGLTPTATEQEIKARFRQLAKKYHPDRQPNETLKQQATEQFRIILQAYEQIKKQRGFS